MAVRVLQLCLVFTIGYYLAPAAIDAVANEALEIPLSLHLQDPKDVTVARGQSATLRCKIERFVDDTNIRIRWQYNDAHIPLNDSRWEVQDDGSLYIPKVAGKRVNSVEGLYRCHIKNEFGALISGPARLKIATLGREFVEQPADVDVAVGQPVVLPCKIHSFPSAVVTWERDNVPLPHNTTRYVPLPTGALLITSTHSSDAGSYRCKIANQILMKTKYSSAGRLVVSPPPTIIAPNLLPLGVGPNVTVLVGQNLTLYCVVSGRPVPLIQWLKNGSVVVGNSTALELKNVTAEAAGNYTCSGRDGRAFQVYHVVVQQPPYFNVTPMSIRYPSSRTLRLQCQANGIPKPKIHWLVNGTRLDFDFRKKENPNGLVISHSFSTDAGLYQCIAENSVGRNWVAAQLVSMFSSRPPPPTDVRCRPYDDNSICLQWSTPPSIVPNAYSVYSYYAEMGPEFITNYTYQLADNLNRSTNYTFYIRLYSKEASDQSQNVTCETGTNGERNLQVQIIDDSIELTWFAISSDITCNDVRGNYRVQWKRAKQPFTYVEYVNKLRYVINDVEPLVPYLYRVISATYKNEIGRWVSFTAPSAQNNTQRETDSRNETEPTAPYNLSAEVLTADSINLTWSSTNPLNGLFSVCFVDVKSDKSCKSKEPPVTRANHIRIRKLKPSTSYEFKVRAHSDDGLYSSYSRTIEVQTFQEGPGTIRELKYRVVNSTTVCLKWRAPYIKGGKLIRYIISYTSDKNSPMEDWQSTNITASMRSYRACSLDTEDTLSVLLSHLDPNTYYTVTVKGDNATVINPASPITLSTKESLKYPNYGTDNVDMEEIYFKQKLGFVLGIVISLASVICFAGCLIFRKHWLKKTALSRARLRASANYYASNVGAPPCSTVQIRRQESSGTESQEMQNLIGENGSAPVITHLDTKGGAGFPNRQTNGDVKHMNGSVPNGHMHITENPRVSTQVVGRNVSPSLVLQFYAPEPNGVKIPPEFEEDSNSNLQNLKLRKLFVGNHRNKSNGQLRVSYDDDDDEFNLTQLTCLDDSIGSAYRKISAPLGPNG